MINKRVFGSPIPINIQKKLEARQLAAVGDKKPFDEINSNYKDTRPSRYKYNELIANNFNMEADLSSRTPFARMWTGISLVDEHSYVIKKTDDSVNSSDAKSVTDNEGNDNDLTKVNSIINQIKFEELAKTVYIVGTNNLSTLDGSMNPNQSLQSSDYVAVFPTEHGVDGDNNKFMKPTAGITSVESGTEGILGSIKKTTVNFEVHNFHDYDKIYSKFFLRPGAQIFVDFGWDVLKDSNGNNIDLYDPYDILNLKSTQNQVAEGEKIEHNLYGEKGVDGQDEDGFVTKCNGDVETIVGIVTDYSAKVRENGSVECSVTITSKNSALISYPKHIGNPTNTIQKFLFDLDNLIFYEQAYRFGNLTDQQNLDAQIERITNASKSVEDELAFQNSQAIMKLASFGATNFVPTALALISGLFVSGEESPTDSFISWGLLEDRILNKYFGHGDDLHSINKEKGNFSININSSDAFTSFEPGFLEKQDEIDDAPNFVIPMNWDVTYNNPASEKHGKVDDSERQTKYRNLRIKEFQEAGNKTVNEFNYSDYTTEASYKRQKYFENKAVKDFIKKAYSRDYYKSRFGEFDPANSKAYSFYSSDKYSLENLAQAYGDSYRVYEVDGFVTSYDKEIGKRLPIRDVFVNMSVVRKAFTNENNTTFRDVVQEILDAINEDSYDLWDWQITGEDNNLKINDMNYSPIVVGTIDERKSKFDKMFMFEVMSKNSIVTNYETSFDMPDGDIASMYAIQAMTGSPGKMDPITKVIESQSALLSILNKFNRDLKKVGFRYLPDLGAYAASNMDSNQFDAATKAQYYNDVKKVFGKSSALEPSYGAGIGTTNPSVYWSQDLQDSAKKTKEADEEDEIDYNVNARVEQSIVQMEEEGIDVVTNLEDYFEHKITGEYIVNDHFKPIPLPMKLELTLYGISSLKPGDTFRVDYLPEVYLNSVYFQVMAVSHKVDSTGWYTTLETQFRISPHQYEDSNMETAPADGTDEGQENLKDALQNSDLNLKDSDIEQIVGKVEIKKEKHKKKKSDQAFSSDLISSNQDKGGILDADIDDSTAYIWGTDGKAHATRWGNLRMQGSWYGYPSIYHHYWQRTNYGPLHPYSQGKYDWDYIGTDEEAEIVDKKVVVKNAEVLKWPEYKVSVSNYKRAIKPVISDVIILRGFQESVKGFLTECKNLKNIAKKYYHFKYVFEAKIQSDLPVFIGNPLYYWAEGNNAYDGYGNANNIELQNNLENDKGAQFGYLGGIYWPGEKVYMVINKHDPVRHWGIFPNNPNSKTTFDTINVSTYSTYWDDKEYYDETQGKSPSRY